MMRPLPIFAALFVGSSLASIDWAILGSPGGSFFATIVAVVSAGCIVGLALDYVIIAGTALEGKLDVMSGRMTEEEADNKLRGEATKLGYNTKRWRKFEMPGAS